MEKMTYKKAGVDIKKADDFAKKIKLDTVSRVEAFGALFNLKTVLREYKNPVLVSSTDGVGTKLKIAQALGIHNTVGIDLVAMNVNDIVCLGAKPLFFLDYIACGSINTRTLTEVVRGIRRGLEEADCLLLGGETAEMPGMYKENEYDLAGFCVGIVEKNSITNGKNIKPGDVIIGLSSNGLHSNGFSLVRKALGSKGIKKYANELLKPTRIYVKPILSVISRKRSPTSFIKGIAHITGGAFYNKAAKIMPHGLGMVIDKASWKIPKIFQIIQDKTHLDTRQMYTTFNMGIGMIVVVAKKYVREVTRTLNKFTPAYIIGEIIATQTKMELI